MKLIYAVGLVAVIKNCGSAEFGRLFFSLSLHRGIMIVGQISRGVSCWYFHVRKLGNYEKIPSSENLPAHHWLA